MNEEQLNQAADDYCYVNLYDGKYCGQDVYEAFQDGMKHIMELPLADRLTESEKEKIKNFYKKEIEWESYYLQKLNRAQQEKESSGILLNQHILKRALLEDIFGTDLFTPKTDTK